MRDVWCIVSADNRRAVELTEVLLAHRHPVAVITADTEPWALLVNRYADAVLPVEVRDAEIFALTEAMWAIEQNLGAVDVIAIAGADDEADRMREAAEFFGARWPDAEIIAVPASPFAAAPALGVTALTPLGEAPVRRRP